jgi:DNA-binding transcriptional ArsR family regulator
LAKQTSHADRLSRAAPLFSALGDPVRLAIVARLSKEGPLSTIALKESAGSLSRQGVTKHLQILQEVGLVDGERVGRDRLWRLRVQQLAAAREYIDWMSARWDQRLERLRALVEEGEF